MAKITIITNPLTGQPAQVDQLEHTAQEIDDAIARALPGGEIDNDVNVLDSRMNEFTSLPDGSTSGDAELADIRVGQDGTVYSTAGNAVRAQVAQLKEDIGQIENDVNVLDSRMNEFASLPDGSTSGDAELADIRVGYDGTSYDSAGQAVRAQVGQLNQKKVGKDGSSTTAFSFGYDAGGLYVVTP